MRAHHVSGPVPRRFLAVLIALLLTSGVVPALGPLAAATVPQGYLVYRDALPVGPDLDAAFHVIVPDGASVLSATLDLWGTVGVIPVAAETTSAGLHTHDLAPSGAHDHTLEEAGDHNHTVPVGGEHTHPVSVQLVQPSLEPAKMSVSLPSHTHNSGGTAVFSYDFAPQTSLPHNHTVKAHSHTTTIPLSGSHGHTTDVAGAHNHTVDASGDHTHDSSAAGDHTHSLEPGASLDVDGTRPSDVKVAVTRGATTARISGSFGSADADWYAGVDVGGLLQSGESTVTITSTSNGTVEYLLVISIDSRYAVLTGHGVVGPGAALEVPIWTPGQPVSARAYLYGSGVPTVVSSVGVAGAHEHLALEAGNHTHTLSVAGAHGHSVSGGEHTHDISVSTDIVDVVAATPDWNLLPHSHGLTWQGGVIVDVGSSSYGTVDSLNHVHSTVPHDHLVDMTPSGAHSHNLSVDGAHTHTASIAAPHTHVVTPAGAHAHEAEFSPSATALPGPVGVMASLDGADLTDSGGGPWALAASPVALDMDASALGGQHVLNLTAATPGAVEWVVLLGLEKVQLLMSMRSTGSLQGHVPVPDQAVGATVALYESPYVMPLDPTLTVGGAHVHTSSLNGSHVHQVADAGAHTHSLLAATHDHTLLLDNATFEILNATATVDLPAHTHTVIQGSPSTGATRVTGTTGSHTHMTGPHTHNVTWASTGAHDHTVVHAGDHTHEVAAAGAHTHTLSGGAHTHRTVAGVHGDASYPSPANASVLLDGSPIATSVHPGAAARWWAGTDVGESHLSKGARQYLSVLSPTVGTQNAIVLMSIDVTPPTLTLVSAQSWVRPGETFTVVVNASERLDPATVNVTVGPARVQGVTYDDATLTISAALEFPLNTRDGMYDVVAVAADLTGNLATVTVGQVGLDGTPPTASASVGPPKVPGEGFTWVTTGTPIDLATVDSGSGPHGAQYAFSEDGPWKDWNATDRYILSGQADGDLTLLYRGVDAAGNVGSEASIALRMDNTPPKVTVTITPSSSAERPLGLWAGSYSVVSMASDDGTGVGPVQPLYQLNDGLETPVWSAYDRPFLVPSAAAVVDGTPTFTLTWRGVDRLGNTGVDLGNTTTVGLDLAAPAVDPSRDLVVPDRAMRSPVKIEGVVSTDAVVIHFRADNGVAGTAPVGANGAVSVFVDVAEGENVILYQLEDHVGNISPWTFAGTVTLDTEVPTLVRSSPSDGDANVAPGTLTMWLTFSEPVSSVHYTLKINGRSAGGGTVGNDTDVADFTSKGVPSSALVSVSITSTDLAGNIGYANISFNSGKEAAKATGGGRGDFLWGLVIGLVLGMVLIYLVVSRRREGGGGGGKRATSRRRVSEIELRPGMGILSPDEGLGETPPARERARPAMEEGEAEAEEAGAVVEEEEDAVAAGAEGEAGGEPEPGETADRAGEVEDEPGDEVEDDELSQELDDIIDKARSPSGPETDGGSVDDADGPELPDPDEETVDPGAR